MVAVRIRAATEALRNVGKLIDVGTFENFIRAHIPGSVRSPIRGDLKSAILPTSILDFESASRLFSDLDIRDKTPCIVYDTGEMLPSTRLAFVLRYWGVRDVSVLSGGFTSYLTKGGRACSGYSEMAEEKEVVNPSLQPTPDDSLLVGWEEVFKASSKNCGAQIIDARSPGEFSGVDMKGLPRGGHIPTAINIPWGEVISPKTREYLAQGELRALFQSRGVDLERPALVLCLAGVRASAVATALEAAGATGGVKVYEGSMAEWSLMTELPILC